MRASAHITTKDAEILLLHVAGRGRAWLRAYPEAELPLEQETELFGLVERRAARHPLQYLTGRQEFFGLDLRVTPDVLIPRPETELLVEAVVRWARTQRSQKLRVVDVGTGSGAIAFALASELPEAELWALDLSAPALAVAKANAHRLGLANRVRLLESDLLASLRHHEDIQAIPLDVVASNPPYVPLRDATEMQPEVRDFEPHLALFAEEDGLSVYRRLIPQAWDALRGGGLLAMEFGYGQRDALSELLARWNAVTFLDDYAGIPRVALAERP